MHVQYVSVNTIKRIKISVIDYDLTITSEDWDPDDDPIIQLPCKHVYTISSLDGHFELDKVYKQNTKNRRIY